MQICVHLDNQILSNSQISYIYIQAFDLKTASIKVQFPPIHMYK